MSLNHYCQDDDNDDGLMTTNLESKKEKREYGSISYNVYLQYMKVGTKDLLVTNFSITRYFIHLGWRSHIAGNIFISQCGSTKHEGFLIS